MLIIYYLLMRFYFLVMVLLGGFLLIVVVVFFLTGVVNPFWDSIKRVLLDLVIFFYWGSSMTR
jgi:hypothetical protein